MPDSFDKLACDDVVIEGFVDSLDEVFQRCKVFVAPLVSGAGIKGKVLDAMSYGVPSVLSPVAAEGTPLTHGSTAWIAESPDDWVSHIATLYEDQTQWQACSERLAELVAGNFSFDAGAQRMQKPLSYLGIFPPRRQQAQPARSAA